AHDRDVRRDLMVREKPRKPAPAIEVVGDVEPGVGGNPFHRRESARAEGRVAGKNDQATEREPVRKLHSGPGADAPGFRKPEREEKSSRPPDDKRPMDLEVAPKRLDEIHGGWRKSEKLDEPRRTIKLHAQ